MKKTASTQFDGMDLRNLRELCEEKGLTVNDGENRDDLIAKLSKTTPAE